MGDRTYCSIKDCPFRYCNRHPIYIPTDLKYVSVADFSGVCKTYISWLVERTMEEGERE